MNNRLYKTYTNADVKTWAEGPRNITFEELLLYWETEIKKEPSYACECYTTFDYLDLNAFALERSERIETNAEYEKLFLPVRILRVLKYAADPKSPFYEIEYQRRKLPYEKINPYDQWTGPRVVYSHETDKKFYNDVDLLFVMKLSVGIPIYMTTQEERPGILIQKNFSPNWENEAGNIIL